MAIHRRKGWIRLDIVLSLAWLLGLAVYSAYEHSRAKSHFSASFQETMACPA